MPAFTPQPQSVTALWPVLIFRPAEGRRLSYKPSWFTRPQTVTHPSNRPRRKVTWLIETNVLPLSQAATIYTQHVTQVTEYIH